LRAAVEARGLNALVADTGEEVMGKLASEINEGPSIDNFDPLMGAHNAILSNAIEMGGLSVLAGEVCPLCWLNEQSKEAWEHARDVDGLQPGDKCPCPDPECTVVFPEEPMSYDVWIDRAADDMVVAWQEMKP
jgi:hypothetical protein